MVEIPTSSCDKVTTKNVFTGSYGFLERGARVVNLFTRSKKDASPEGNLESEAVLTPELVSLLARNSIPRLDINSTRTNSDAFLYKDGMDLEMALSRHGSESSREFIYKTPAEFASNSTISITSPELRLQEFEQELAKLKAERTRQRNALREQVLSEIDVRAQVDSVSTQSNSMLVPKSFGTISELDDRSSLSTRSSEENLTFQDATDDLNEEEKTESEGTNNTSNSKSVDFSILHSVRRTKDKHEEAILLRMKYAGNTGLRTDQDSDDLTTNTVSSNSILNSIPPRAETKLLKECENIILETLRKCEVGGKKQRFYERPTEPDVVSLSASGSTTPRQRCDRSAETSNKPSITSVKTSTESQSKAVSQQESPVASEESSPSESRSSSPSPESKSTSQASFQQSFTGYPNSESPSIDSNNCDNQEPPTFQRISCYKQPLKSPECKEYRRLPIVNYNHDYYDAETTRLYGHNYPTSDAGTEEHWSYRATSDRSGRSGRRKHSVDIPITIDGRIVYPEVILAEDNQAAQSRGPLGLLERVKSFAKNCGPNEEETNTERSASTSTFSDGPLDGEKASAQLNSTLLSRLICIACGLLCTPPVAMCVWGHIVCEECRPIGLWENPGTCWCRKRCPQCAGDMLSRPCQLWTNIARSLLYPCRFTSNGCHESQGLTPAEKMIHEETCRWRQLRCWCPGCSWRGVWYQMRAHVVKIHLSKATRADWYRFVNVNGALSTGRSSDVIALPANELVLLHSLAVIGEQRYLLQYLNDDGSGGTVLFVPRFKLRLVSTECKVEVEVKGEAVSLQHDVERALRSGRCFRLSGAPFGKDTIDDTAAPENVSVQLCLEKGRLSAL